MVQRGLYQLCYRGLSWGELRRFSEGKPTMFLIALAFKLAARRGAKVWLPAAETERPCAEDELSERARARLLPAVEEARALGYGNGRFATLARKDDPSSKEGFSYAALHGDGVRTLFLGFVISQVGDHPPMEKLAVAGAINLADGSSVAFTGERIYLDGASNVKRVHLVDGSVANVHDAMGRRVASEGFSARRFDTWEAMKRHADEATDAAFAARIRRGLYVRLSGTEAT